MASRRQFLTTAGVSAAVAALLGSSIAPTPPPPAGGPSSGADPDRDERLRAEFRRYASLAAAAQSVPPPEG